MAGASASVQAIARLIREHAHHEHIEIEARLGTFGDYTGADTNPFRSSVSNATFTALARGLLNAGWAPMGDDDDGGGVDGGGGGGGGGDGSDDNGGDGDGDTGHSVGEFMDTRYADYFCTNDIGNSVRVTVFAGGPPPQPSTYAVEKRRLKTVDCVYKTSPFDLRVSASVELPATVPRNYAAKTDWTAVRRKHRWTFVRKDVLVSLTVVRPRRLVTATDATLPKDDTMGRMDRMDRMGMDCTNETSDHRHHLWVDRGHDHLLEVEVELRPHVLAKIAESPTDQSATEAARLLVSMVQKLAALAEPYTDPPDLGNLVLRGGQ